MPDTFMNSHRVEITSLAARYLLPAVYPYRIFAEVGGLLAYANDLLDNYRRVATYADRILNGATFQSRLRSSFIWLSTSRPPKRSVLPCQQHCSPPPTR